MAEIHALFVANKEINLLFCASHASPAFPVPSSYFLLIFYHPYGSYFKCNPSPSVYNNNFLLLPTFLVPIFWHHLSLPTLNIVFRMNVTLASFSSYFKCNRLFSTIHMIPPPQLYLLFRLAKWLNLVPLFSRRVPLKVGSYEISWLGL